MSKWQYESDITPSTVTFTDTVNQEWVMRITPARKIEVNEDVEVTEAAQKVLDALQVLMDRQRKALSDDEIGKISFECQITDL